MDLDLFSQDRESKNLKGRLRLAIRKRFFTPRVVENWNRLPREVVMAPSLTIFKQHLDNALRHIV